MQRVINPANGKFRRFEMPEEEYLDLVDCNDGLCVACGSVQGCVEPDAERYTCEACRSMTVYGVEGLLARGRIVFPEASSDA